MPKAKKVYQIVIEGSDFEQVQELFEAIQNEHSLFDNCVMQEVDKKDSIVGCWRLSSSRRSCPKKTKRIVLLAAAAAEKKKQEN